MKAASIIALCAASFAFALPPAKNGGKGLQDKAAANSCNDNKAMENAPGMIDREKERQEREICIVPFEKARQGFVDCKSNAGTNDKACKDTLRGETQRYALCMSNHLNLPSGSTAVSADCRQKHFKENLDCLDQWYKNFE